MAASYFEMNDCAIPYRVFGQILTNKHSCWSYSKKPPFELIQCADRIWVEDCEHVRFLKNRFCDPESEVDLKEFFWIKLSSVQM